ncbi:MAG TPA: alkaline phosphatase family protein [Thermoanaerobaculia bacterium]|nr:alkaline phosphatase family protein [Thermoanaerobaculia bacterium]
MSLPLLLLFVDGLGLAPSGAHNPLATTPTPTLARLVGGALTVERIGARGDGDFVLRAIDAVLGVPGLPQSGTGQTALFTGVNAPLAVGRHVVAFPGPRLRALLADHGLFRRAIEAGLSCAFANAFSARYFELLDARRLRRSASVVLAESAGVRLRGMDELRAGAALTWDIERDRFARGDDDRVESIPAASAGRQLAELASRHQLTLFETFFTDLAGHRRDGFDAGEALRRVDALLGGVLESAPRRRLTVVLTSDHGNLEDGATSRHTRNPVPLLAIGPRAADFAGAASLLDVATAMLAGGAASDRRGHRATTSGGGGMVGSTQDVGVAP